MVLDVYSDSDKWFQVSNSRLELTPIPFFWISANTSANSGSSLRSCMSVEEGQVIGSAGHGRVSEDRVYSLIPPGKALGANAQVGGWA